MSGDSYFSNVALLLPGDTFTDASNSRAPVFASGISISGAFPGVLAKSFWFTAHLTGTPLYVTAPTVTYIDPAEDFTIELSAYCQRNTYGSALYSNRAPGGPANGLLIGLDPTGRPFVRVTANGVLVVQINTYYPITLNALHTFELERMSGLWTLFVDGIAQTDYQHVAIYNGAVDHGTNIYVGCDPYTSPFLGAISQVRVTMGVARYIGQHAVPILPYPLYPTNPDVNFGALTTSIATANTTYTALVTLSNTVSASIRAINGANVPVGSNWAIIPNPSGAADSWSITGTAPSAVTDFYLVITVVTPVSLGGLTTSHSYTINNTSNGSISVEQTLLRSVPGLALWLDASDTTTMLLAANNTDVTQISDKSAGIVFAAATGKPPPLIDTTAFTGKNSFKFPNNASSGLLSASPVVVSDASSNSTIFMVAKYTGQQLGQGGGTFQLAYLPDSAIVDGASTWALATTNVGAANASASFYDNSAMQDGATTAAVIASGASFLVTWRSTANVAEIFINQKLVATTAALGSINQWAAINSAIRFIGGTNSPSGAFISVGQIVAYTTDLDNSTTEKLSSYLNHKWGIYPLVPYAQTPTVTSGYLGDLYSSTVVVTDATSVTVSANSGTGWSIAPSNTGVANLYVVTGTLPNTAQTTQLTITSNNGAIVGVDVYPILVKAIPTTPTIAPPLNLACQTSSGYVSYVDIFSADTVSVSANSGTGWTITSAPVGQLGNYIVRGTMPSTVGVVILTINASKTQSTGIVSTVSNQFNILATVNQVATSTPYALDLTGLLSTNKITDERQTLTPSNGALHQLISPILAPFFGSSLVIKYYLPNGQARTATLNVDYELVLQHVELSNACQTPVYGGISFSNPAIFGTVLLTYQTLGGNFALDKKALIEQLFNYSVNPKFVSWRAISGLPTYFPVASHKLNVHNDSVGYTAMVAALTALATGIGVVHTDTDKAPMTAHIANVSNPHNITAAKLNLGNVQNYPLATNSQAVDPANVQSYLTPQTAYLAINNALLGATDTIKGKMLINLGLLAGDDTDLTKGLTARGLINLLSAVETNAVNALFVSGITAAQTPAKLSPAPPTFPVWWKGKRYFTATALINAIQTYVGVSPLPYNAVTGTLYFPVGITIPSLVTTPTYVAGTQATKKVTGNVTQSMIVTQ